GADHPDDAGVGDRTRRLSGRRLPQAARRGTAPATRRRGRKWTWGFHQSLFPPGVGGEGETREAMVGIGGKRRYFRGGGALLRDRRTARRGSCGGIADGVRLQPRRPERPAGAPAKRGLRPG